MSLEERKKELRERFEALILEIEKAENLTYMIGHNLDLIRLINEGAGLKHDYEMAKAITEIKEKTVFAGLSNTAQGASVKEREAEVFKNEEYQKVVLKSAEADASSAEVYKLVSTMERLSDFLIRAIDKVKTL